MGYLYIFNLTFQGPVREVSFFFFRCPGTGTGFPGRCPLVIVKLSSQSTAMRKHFSLVKKGLVQTHQ